MRCLVALVLGITFVAPLAAQRAQLPARGRKPDESTPRAAPPVRKLPRRGDRGEERTFPASSLQRHIEAETARLAAGARPRSPEPEPVPDSPYSRPRKPLADDPIAGLLPPFDVEAAQAGRSFPNRWRVELPEWRRYENKKLDIVYARERLWDPYNRNVLKGDYPAFGRTHFINIALSSDTLTETRRIPLGSPASASDAGNYEFFAPGDQFTVRQSFRTSFEYFHGSAAFKPVDYLVRITPEFNINHNVARDNGILAIDVRRGIHRTDSHVGMQEALFEVRLGTNSTRMFRKPRDQDDRGSAYFDFTSLRAGIQRFTSDFRGFIYSDEQPGARLFGTFHNKSFEYNLAYFNLLEKDTNSFLNRWRLRNQSVWAANLYWFDAFTKGYNLNFSMLYNNDQPKFHIDRNGFLVRPAPIGTPVPNKVRAGYAGISGDGHIGRYNISHAFYQAFGRHDFNVIAGKPLHINAQLAAVELAYEKDWQIYKVSAFYTSGDRDLLDGKAGGFDGIVPNQQFAGGGFLGNATLADRGLQNNLFEGGGTNFLNRQPIPLTGTGTVLFGLNSLMPAMRAGLVQGQANFVNPGVIVLNAGYDAKLTPKLRLTANANYLRFDRTQVLEAVLFQAPIRHPIGVDTGFGLQYRPLLSENVVFTSGFGTLFPMQGFKDIYTGRTLFSGFLALRLLF